MISSLVRTIGSVSCGRGVGVGSAAAHGGLGGCVQPRSSPSVPMTHMCGNVLSSRMGKSGSKVGLMRTEKWSFCIQIHKFNERAEGQLRKELCTVWRKMVLFTNVVLLRDSMSPPPTLCLHFPHFVSTSHTRTVRSFEALASSPPGRLTNAKTIMRVCFRLASRARSAPTLLPARTKLLLRPPPRRWKDG